MGQSFFTAGVSPLQWCKYPTEVEEIMLIYANGGYGLQVFDVGI